MTKFGVPTDEQLSKINKLAKRTLSADEVFAFSGKSAGDMLIPNRYTKISKELLQVMVDDAQKSVSFMYNHNWGSSQGLKGVPYGKVFDGEIKASTENDETVGLYLSKYIVRDDEVVDGMSANALIKKIESGVLSDTSISFNTDTMVCSICEMNYYSGKCSHYRGRKYEMADGATKTCTVTAMPPSIIIPYNNNALYEESIVWDGAYPGAMVSQSKDGDIIELPTGNFAVLGEKEELPDNTTFINRYCKGDMFTVVKKSDHKKIYNLGGKVKDESLTIVGGNGEKITLKGSEDSMNEKMLEMLMSIGFTKEEAESLDVGQATTALNAMVEKWETSGTSKIDLPLIKLSNGNVINVDGMKAALERSVLVSKELINEKLGAELSVDDVLKLAKEGQEYHKSLSDEAIAMGVRAMGNDFPKETWENSFANMDTKLIKDMKKTWELQVNADITPGRISDPTATQKKASSIPDELFGI